MNTIITLHRFFATVAARLPGHYAAARIFAALALALLLAACAGSHHH